jgi:hypothetical protein
MIIRSAWSAVLLVFAPFGLAQESNPVQQALVQMQQAGSKNRMALRSYQWKEAVSVTDDSHQVPTRESLCRYAADGTVLKTPLGPSEESGPAKTGPLRRHIMNQKEDEVKDVSAVAEQYLPHNPDRLREEAASGRAVAGQESMGSPTLIFAGYQKQSDQMKLVLDPASKQFVRIEVSSYTDNGKSSVMIKAEFARLDDGTLYPAQTTINAPEKKITIVTANTNYTKVSP